MVQLPHHFSRFHDEISLNPTRAKRIDRAIQSISDFIEIDAPLQQYMRGNPLLIGSFATDTVVRPINKARGYDVDILLPMDFNRFPADLFDNKRTPDYIFKYLQSRLKTNYGVRVERRNRCVRMNYKGEFHIDLVPAHATDGVSGFYQICDREEDSFVNTDPIAYIRWVRGLDEFYGGRFCRSLKMLKRWRDLRCGTEYAPPSLHMVVLAGHALMKYAEKSNKPFTWLSEDNSSMEAFLWDASNSMYHYLYGGFWGPSLKMPGEVDEDLIDTWPSSSRAQFRGRLETFINRAEVALNTKRESTAINRWQENFGPAFVTRP